MADLEQIRQVLKQLEESFAQEVSRASSPQFLEQVRIKYLGRKSPISVYMKELGALSAQERSLLGKELNQLKISFEQRLQDAARIASQAPPLDSVDVTLPGASIPLGRLHPVTQTIQRIVNCFIPLGFEIVEGPELEYEFNNFDALNIPADHPSRENFDTFFVEAPSPDPKKGKLLLRSHTSPVQVRLMQRRKPPLQIIVPGRVFRPDPLDASHSFMFHQVEGLMVDDRTNFSDLKGVLYRFVKDMFGERTKMRFRPHFFPFTEPSAEVDIACASCSGSGCQTCGRKGWLEILGCGMVHPNVFRAVGYEAGKVQGFAFGMGVERIAMLKYGIKDIRMFFENDLRFLEEF